MGSTRLTLTKERPEDYDGDLLVTCLGLNHKDKIKSYDGPGSTELVAAIGLGDFKGKPGHTLLVYHKTVSAKKASVQRVLFLGLGKLRDKKTFELAELCRDVGGTLAAKAKELRCLKIALCLPEMEGLAAEEVLESLLEGVLLSDYRFGKYKTTLPVDKEPPFAGIKEVLIYVKDVSKGLRRAMVLAQHAAAAACTARDMANEPGNGWTPESFASYGRSLAKAYPMSCRVLDKEDMERLQMGGLLGVNQGSAEAPRLIILEYTTGKKEAQTILLVGKGLTFDSGGVSLKPASGMQDMKYDMCGGAAVLSAMAVVGQEKPGVNVVAIVPATDNMAGSSALKPGDIISHYGGITSEIVNTDAEGRLILADALAYGIKTFKPTCVVDLATLTGAVIMGLGHHRTGLLGNSQILVERLLRAGESCGEPLWQLPLDEEYVKQIDSEVADIKNSGGRPAGTITAAAYLQKFVGDTPWVHLDIAGTAWDFTKKSYIPKGPSGTGVRTLVELIRNWQKLS